ncbi:GYDIA family GHMP kinase [uncultured Dokdonia sp.]|uniref:GYDIA family GHMP kinase n=1 Tax=uncultured Dokdonia sp. TaxID=575653 RepID=UPI0026140BBD|nr:GYDIA family GHMP kinase [uncultured Dokdonia sp.]
MHSFYSHGKLLLTAEYLVLDGAKALAIPTKKGQSLTISTSNTPTLQWKSILHDDSLWFETEITLPLTQGKSFEDPIITTLYEILSAAQSLNPTFLNTQQGYTAISTLEFPRNWGLGSSSTLITNIAQWAQVNPYELLDKTFGGSGYDIACATAATPITYIKKDTAPLVTPVIFSPSFKEQVFFIHLNRKQNSRDSISHYRNLSHVEKELKIESFTSHTVAMIASQDSLHDFQELVTTHESELSSVLQTPTIKKQLFPTYPKAIKSLGGWGGDFILVVGTSEDMNYFKEKGYTTIIPFSEMVLS